jgi:hypothetical protein
VQTRQVGPRSGGSPLNCTAKWGPCSSRCRATPGPHEPAPCGGAGTRRSGSDAPPVACSRGSEVKAAPMAQVVRQRGIPTKASQTGRTQGPLEGRGQRGIPSKALVATRAPPREALAGPACCWIGPVPSSREGAEAEDWQGRAHLHPAASKAAQGHDRQGRTRPSTEWRRRSIIDSFWR